MLLRRRRKRNEKGAALVEAAIVFVPLCLIVFGIIEYGFIFKDSLTLSSATRAGARAASAQPNVAPETFFPYVMQATEKAASAADFKNGDTMWIYKANTNGDPVNPCGTTGSQTCVVYRYNGSSWVQQTGGSWDTVNNVSACLGTATPGAGIDSVGVRLQLSHDAITNFFKNLQLKEKTVMKFEPTSNNC
jgi:hypothetical protein